MATAKDVLDRAREVLNDPSKVRWTDAALFYWLSDALDLLRTKAPDLFIQCGEHTCTAGAAQTLILTNARDFLAVEGVLPCDIATLDAFNPAWRSVTAGATVNWMPSTKPKEFFVYPPSAVGQKLMVRYTTTPAEITAITDALPVSDDFVSPLADYVISMAESKDADHVNSGRAQAFAQAFAAKLGIAKE